MPELTPKQQKNLQRLARIIDKGNIGVFEYLVELEDKLDADIPQIKDIISRLKGKDGDDYVLTEKDKQSIREDLYKSIISQIPDVKDGQDYILTKADKKEIAKSIKVPVVEKIIEKIETIRELPFVTKEVKEIRIENSDTGEKIVDKINSQNTLIKKERIEGLRAIEDRITAVGEKRGGGPTMKVVAGSNITVTERGGDYVVSSTASGPGVTLKTNGTNNGSQSILNLTEGTGITLTDDGVGGITIDSSGSSQNLQEVTDIGAITTNSVQVGALTATGNVEAGAILSGATLSTDAGSIYTDGGGNFYANTSITTPALTLNGLNGAVGDGSGYVTDYLGAYLTTQYSDNAGFAYNADTVNSLSGHDNTELSNGAGYITSSGTSAVATTVTVANEATDTTCFVNFTTAATGNLGIKSNANLAFNSNTGYFSMGASGTRLVIEGGTTGGTRGANATDIQQNVTSTTIASGSQAQAFGYRNTASNTGSGAVGWTNSTAGLRGQAHGYGNVASGVDSVAFGNANTASNSGTGLSSAIGTSNNSSGAYSTAVGHSNTANGTAGCSAIGVGNSASGTDSSAIGRSNTVAGQNSSGIGFSNTVGTGVNNFAIGLQNTTGTAVGSLAFGLGNNVTGAGSAAYGQQLTTSAGTAIMLGYLMTNTTASSVEIGVSDASKIRVDSSGFLAVGLGNTAAGARLHVQHATAATNTVNSLLISRWTRAQTGGVKYGNAFDINLGSYGTSVNSQSRVDFRVANGATDTPDTTVMTLAGSQVGIGTTAPSTGLLDVMAGGNPNMLLSYSAGLGVKFTTTATGVLQLLDVGGTTNQAILSITRTSAVTGNYTKGIEISVQPSASTAVSIGADYTAYAMPSAVPTSEQIGMQMVSGFQAGAGTLPYMYGMKSLAWMISAGTATNVYSVYGNVGGFTAAATGTITNGYGGHFTITKTAGGASATITNGYNMFLGSNDATNAWGIYQEQTGINNYFASKVEVPTLELGHASDTTLSRSSAGVLAVEGVVIPSVSSTNTLTNKRITPRVGTATSSATPTINTDNVDFYSLTAQAVDITSFTTNLSGTPTDGQTLHIAITGTAARAITWGASFEASTVALPTTTVTTARLDVKFIWNAVTSKWRCLAQG